MKRRSQRLTARAWALPFPAALPGHQRWRLGCLGLALFWSVGAAAQDLAALPLEQLLKFEVQAGSRLAQHLGQAPGAVSVLTAAEMRDFGHRTLADALRALPGLHLSYDRNYSYLGVRGYSRAGDYNSRVLLLVDGLRFNDNVYDQASLGTDFPIDLGLVERLEFIPGPGSAAYGSNAVLGVINVVTRAPAQWPGWHATAGVGSGRSGELALATGQALGRGDLLLAFSARRSRGEDWQYPELAESGVAEGWVRGKDTDRSQRFFLRYVDPQWKFLLLHGERTKGIPTGSFGTAAQAEGNETVDASTFADLSHRRALPGDWEVQARAFAGRYAYRGRYVYDLPPLVDNVDRALGQWWGLEARLASPARGDNRLVLGVEYQFDRRQDQWNFDAEPYASYLEDHRRGRRLGIYLEDEWRLGATRLNLGARYDRGATGGGVLSPRLALVHEPRPDHFLKLILGSAFRDPNAYERFYAATGEAGQKPNPQLQRERIRTAELAYERHFAAGTRGLVSVYQYHIRDLIGVVVDPDDGLQVFQNIGRASARGAQLAFEHQGGDGQRLRLSLGAQSAEDENGQRLLNSPRVLAKVAYARQLPLLEGRFGAELQYVGPRLSLGPELGGHTVANVNLRFQLAPSAVLGLGVYNLLDRRFADPGGLEHVQTSIQQDGRNFRLTLELSWL